MKRIAFLLFFVVFSTFAQNNPDVALLQNRTAIANFYNQLNLLDSEAITKLRITHIGDSHIQADFFTGAMRTYFQKRFGNGGLGFAFPYKLAKTNGSRWAKFTSNVSFDAVRNVKAVTKLPIGLSGYSFESKHLQTAIKIRVNPKYRFNRITIWTDNPNSFNFADYQSTTRFDQLIPLHSVKIHRVKSGESLYQISKKYHITVKKLKKANHLKRNLIHPKQKLKIPIDRMAKVKIHPKDFKFLQADTIAKGQISYYTENARDSIFLFAKNDQKNLNIYAFSIENDQNGVIYDAIGVNGAKCSDYNKYPLFFKQLHNLQSDLIIISMGTNESFDKLSPSLFIERFIEFINKIRTENPNVEILVTTPPPSLIKRRRKNELIAAYRTEILKNMHRYNYAVWDLFTAVGGDNKTRENYKKGWIAHDRIHFTKKGYEVQAKYFFKDIMYYYDNE